jgi:hypothetical protein
LASRCRAVDLTQFGVLNSSPNRPIDDLLAAGSTLFGRFSPITATSLSGKGFHSTTLTSRTIATASPSSREAANFSGCSTKSACCLGRTGRRQDVSLLHMRPGLGSTGTFSCREHRLDALASVTTVGTPCTMQSSS